MSVIVVLQEAGFRNGFESDLSGAGVSFDRFMGLPRHLNVYCDACHPALIDSRVVSVDEEEIIAPSDAQALDIAGDFTADNWALARIIRRRPPWRTDVSEFPVPSFFECVRDGAGVSVYILDTGVRISHDEYGGRAISIYEYTTAGSDGDDNGHGTKMAGYSAGSTVGLARGASIYSCKISTGPDGNASSTSLISGISAMLTHHGESSSPAVCSVSYAFTSGAVLSAISDAIDAGVIMVGAAGNGGDDLTSVNAYPGEAPDAICVGALGPLDIPAFFCRDDGSISKTSYGEVDIMSPGQQLYSPVHTSDTGYLRTAGSTSGATALTSGVIACMLQGHPKLTTRAQVQAVKNKLLANATTGRLKIPGGSHVPAGELPDRILYLDPAQSSPEPIPGL